MIKLLSAFNAKYYLQMQVSIVKELWKDRVPKNLVFGSTMEHNELKNEVKGLASNFCQIF